MYEQSIEKYRITQNKTITRGHDRKGTQDTIPRIIVEMFD